MTHRLVNGRFVWYLNAPVITVGALHEKCMQMIVELAKWLLLNHFLLQFDAASS